MKERYKWLASFGITIVGCGILAIFILLVPWFVFVIVCTTVFIICGVCVMIKERFFNRF